MSDTTDSRRLVALRPDAELRADLEAAAAASGRAVSQEAEHRLRQSFGAQPPSAEDVRLMVREELRAVLAERDAEREKPHDYVVGASPALPAYSYKALYEAMKVSPVAPGRGRGVVKLASPGNGPNLVG